MRVFYWYSEKEVKETNLVMGKIIVVANRLPVEVSFKEDELAFKVSPGGLVSALNAITNKYNLEWVRWPGDMCIIWLPSNQVLRSSLTN